jgi:hypothetical protein
MKTEMSVAEAFKAWAKTPACTCDGVEPHYTATRERRSWNRKLATNVLPEVSVPRPDNEVCERERAWRLYVTLRDSVPREATKKTPTPGFTAQYGFGPVPVAAVPPQFSM